jgi:hypothetical protein
MRHKKIWLLIIVTFLLPIWSTPEALSMPPEQSQLTSWQIVGQVGGPTQAVAVQGIYAFVGVGMRLVVLNITNSASPLEVGSTVPFSSSVEDIVVSGTRAYIAAGTAGLHILDIANPSAPVELGAWDSPGYAEAIGIAGNYAYLADGTYGLRVVDISNPTHPAPIASAYDMNYTFGLALSGNYAYLAAAGAGMLVVNITDPLQPVETARFDTPGYAYSVSVSGSVACVADAWEGLQIVNIADPIHPQPIDAVKTSDWALKTTIVGTTAYVADGKGGLQIVNISTTPTVLGSFRMQDLAIDVFVAGNRAFVSDFTAGLAILDLTDPGNISEIGRYAPMADARRVVVADSYAYVAATSAGMRVVDVSDPTHPKEVGKFVTGSGSYASGIAVEDDLVYLGVYMDTPYSLYVIDVSDHANPTAVGKLPTIGEFWDIALRDKLLYVAYADGLLVVDVSNPAFPVTVGRVDFTGDAFLTTGINLQGNLAFLAESGAGLRIIDVSDPRNPKLVGVYEAPGWVSSLALNGAWAFVLDGQLRIVDVSNPAQPLEKASLVTPGSNTEITYSNEKLYISDGGAGLSIVNVSDPLHPVLEQVVDTPTWAKDAFLVGDYAYVADGFGGLVILQKITPPSPLQVPPTLVPPVVPVRTQINTPEPLGYLDSYQQVNPSSQLIRSAPNLESEPDLADGVLALGATRVVVSAADAGPGTLRQALLDAVVGDTITFDPTVFPPANPAAIVLASNLPPVLQGNLTIDASNAGVILDGHQVPWFAVGLDLDSDRNTVRGLQIVGFNPFGMRSYGSHNIIGGNRGVGAGPSGQGNILSSNNSGIHIGGVDNLILGNLIGTDASGTQAMPNDIGIQVFGKSNKIGGPTPAERNVISGNRWTGIQIIMYYTEDNIVAGNLIGTDITGETALGNYTGIRIEIAASKNTIGSTTPAERNVISGNTFGGIQISDPKTYHNSIIGNYIGVSASGKLPLGNGFGISIDYAGYNRVGGTKPGEENVISGNNSAIVLTSYLYPYNLVLGNLIGTDATGKIAIANTEGVTLARTRQAYLGGMTDEEANLISGNRGNGVVIMEPGTEVNFVLGNRIGLDITGQQPLPNAASGIWIDPYPRKTFIQGNSIAYNAISGIGIWGGTEITLCRNLIFQHPQAGIDLVNGGNHQLSAPKIITVSTNSVSGSACPGCTIEIFSDDGDEGRIFEGNTVADAGGYFTYNKGKPLTGPHITATSTDAVGNTSEFSVLRFLQERFCYLPLILKAP